MSLTALFLEGFEHLGETGTGTQFGAKWNSASSTPTFGASFGRFGGVGARTGIDIRKTITATTTPGIGHAIALTAASLNSGATTGWVPFVFWGTDNVATTYIRINNNGTVSAVTGSPSNTNTAGTILGTSTSAVFLDGAYHHIEAQVFISATVGTVDVWVDEVLVLSLTAKNTKGSSAATQCGMVSVMYANISTTLYDDIAVYDASARTGSSGAWEKYGDCRVQTSFPTGAGTGTVGTWTQTGGTAGQPYTTVNEAPHTSDTSYVADGTVGDVITFTMGDLVNTPASVKAVAVNVVVRKDDASTRSVAGVIRSGGTNALGATTATPGSYIGRQDIFHTDPSTGAAWTPSGVNGMEAGLKVAA